MCVLGFILLSLCASCWSEDSEATPQGDSSRVSQQGTESDAVETERELETETAGGEKSQQQQKLIVAFVPDYPSKYTVHKIHTSNFLELVLRITHPGMLANTTHFIMVKNTKYTHLHTHSLVLFSNTPINTLYPTVLCVVVLPQ